MTRDLIKRLAPALVLAGILLALTAATMFGPLAFELHNPVIIGVPKTADPGLDLDKSRQLIVGVALASLVIAFLVGRYRQKTPDALALVLDLLPLVWMFFFVWSLVHNVSELIPARKHQMFNRNALADAGLAAFVVALSPRTRRGVFAGVLGILVALIGAADILHMRAFGNVIPVGSHGSFTQLWDVRASIVSLVDKKRDLWIGFYLASAAAMLLLWRVKEIKSLRAVRMAAYVVPVVLLSYSFGQIHDDVSTFLGSTWSTEVLNREDQVWNAGFFGAHIREISVNVKNSLARRSPTKAERKDVQAFFRDEHAAHVTDKSPSFGQYKGKNVLILQLEAIEEWLVDATVDGQEITPFLNRLKQRNLFYPHIYDIAAMSHTADCEYLVLNSNHPLPDGAVAFRAEGNHFVTLATTLRDAGYSTLSMHGYRHGMWNRAVLHPRYGFTHSLFEEQLGDSPKVGWGLDDHAFFQKLAVAAKQEPMPWLLYAITLSSHHPYNAIPYNQRRLRLGALENTMVGNYMHSAAFVDDALSKLFAQLAADDLLKDTVVVLYGDHAALLHTSQRERGMVASMTNLPAQTADHIGTGSLNRVPLMFVLPGMEKPEISEGVGAQIDIGPTILHFLGIAPPRPFTGHALVPEAVGGFVARWDGSFVSPPLLFDAGLDECRVISDLRSVPSDRCRALATKARKQLDASWLLTNNDLAEWLAKDAPPLPPPPPKSAIVTLGAACQADTDCAAPEEGFVPRCRGGTCMTEPHGVCDRPGSTDPCALGSACYAWSSEVNLCAADCETFACATTCDAADLCSPMR
jgi:phosphoglycerol transferase MdoB-like AlkP superfamily enzyme